MRMDSYALRAPQTNLSESGPARKCLLASEMRHFTYASDCNTPVSKFKQSAQMQWIEIIIAMDCIESYMTFTNSREMPMLAIE